MKENKTNRYQNQKKKSQKVYIFFLVLGCSLLIYFMLQNADIRNLNVLPISADTGGLDVWNTSGTQEDGDTQWCLQLVNKWNPIQGEHKIETIELSNGYQVDQRIYPYLQSMFDAAREDGVYPIVASGYRTQQRQEEIYNEKFYAYRAEGKSIEEAQKETELWVAVPGTSEHQLGLAVDINADGINSAGGEVYAWLETHAHLYGFIYRYPPEKTDITGVSNEPWHYRYVGVEAATEIYHQGICLEEYLGAVHVS